MGLQGTSSLEEIDGGPSGIDRTSIVRTHSEAWFGGDWPFASRPTQSTVGDRFSPNLPERLRDTFFGG